MSETNKIDLVMTHVFDVPVAQVWNAWVDPEIIKQWWGPIGFSCSLARIDFREGATSIVAMLASPEYGGQENFTTWQYKTIVPMEYIEFVQCLTDANGVKLDTSVMNFPSEFAQDVRTTLQFKALDANRTELIVTEYGWPPGQMVEWSRMGMEQCLDKIAAALVTA